MEYYRHPFAIVDSSNIGANTRIWGFVHIMPRAVIGENCNICEHVFIENDVIIGRNVTVKSGVYIWDGLTIKDNVFIGPNVTFTNDLFPRSKQHPDQFKPTMVEEWASIGANATIIAGITIGKYAMIGAGAVVTKNVPAHTLWYGNPAVCHGYVCSCGQKLDEEFTCSHCHESILRGEES